MLVELFIPVARTDEVPVGTSKVVVVAGHLVALFNVAGRFYALSNVCLHRGGPVGEGDLDGTVVTCPVHGWQYDVRSGQSLTNPSARLRQYEVRVEADRIFVAPP